MDYETHEFKTQADFRTWLEKNHADTDGVWIRMYKKATNIPSVNYAEALDEALCFGWIDGIKKSYDDVSFIQKFTPRRVRSLWSKRNIEHTERLITAGQMTEAGIKEIERAKADGRWDRAYDTFVDMKIPPYFYLELEKHPKAKEFFKELKKTNLYAIGWALQTAKTEETRLRRTKTLIAMLNEGKKP